MTKQIETTRVKYRGILLSEKPVKDKQDSDEWTTYYTFKGRTISVEKNETGYGKVRGAGRWFWTLTEALIYIEKL